jgi:hypothetical protein
MLRIADVFPAASLGLAEWSSDDYTMLQKVDMRCPITAKYKKEKHGNIHKCKAAPPPPECRPIL